MSDLAKTLLCRPVYGFSLFAVWSDTTPSCVVKYEISLPSGGFLPFPPGTLGAALKTYHACTDAWYWFAPPYRLHPIFADNTSDDALRYVISAPDGRVFESSGPPNGLGEALAMFKRLTGIDVTADGALIRDIEKPGQELISTALQRMEFE